MADTTVVVAAAPIPGDALARAEKFAREPFVHEGEDAASVLAEGTPRRRALDAALAEIAEGRDRPSVAWRREFSLMLGLERLLAREEPRLADGTVLSAHQVDALSGTLIALLAEAQGTSRNGGRPGSADGANGAGASVPAVAELPSGEEEIEGDEELGDDEEPLDWDADAEAPGDGDSPDLGEDPGSARRFWFEHATGAGKTVAAVGFVEATRTGGVLILTHRRNLVD